MIPAHKNIAQAAGSLDDLVGACPIADDVAEIDNQVARGRDCKACLQRFEITVNVA